MAKWFPCQKYFNDIYSSALWALYYTVANIPYRPTREKLVDAVAFGNIYYLDGHEALINENQVIPNTEGFSRCDCHKIEKGCVNPLIRPTVGELNSCQNSSGITPRI